MKNHQHSEESELLKLLNLGNHAAFEELYHRYSARISGAIFKIIKSEELTGEILQELFVKIWDKREHIEEGKSFKSYLFRIAQNLVMDHFRKVAIDNRYREHAIRNYTQVYEYTDEQEADAQTKAELDKLLDCLPPKCKAVYILAKVDGCSHKEIADRLKISMPTVNNHLTKAHRLLKKHIAEGKSNGLVLCLLYFVLKDF